MIFRGFWCFCSVSEQETSVSATAQPICGFKKIKLARSSSYACFCPQKVRFCSCMTYPHLHANRLFSLWRLQKALHEPELAPTTTLDDFCRALAVKLRVWRSAYVASFDFAAIRVRISLARPVVVTLTPGIAQNDCCSVYT